MFKSLSKSICISLVISILLSLTLFDAKCTEIKDNVLRLHIMANSNSDADQDIKHKVRKRIISESQSFFGQTENYNQALLQLEENLPQITEMVNDELKEYNQTAKVTIGKSFFDTRRYDSAVLPAGEYTALQVTIGKGEGRNWWCVMFPSMCIPAVSKEYDGEGAEIVNNYEKYIPAFKVVEWYEKLKNKLK